MATEQERIYSAALAAMEAGWRMDPHALKQSTRKGFDPFLIMAAAGSPTVAYAHGPKYPGQWRHIRGGVVVVVEPAVKRIVTIYANVERTALRPDQRR